MMKPTLIFLLFLKILCSNQPSSTIPVSTYSIVAYDPKTGQLGVAVQSHWFSVGFLVPWAKAGVGAVATQSFVKVEYGPDGLGLMEQGLTSDQALEALLKEDKAKDVRQVAMVDINGNVAVHTGSKCIYAAGHYVGKNFSVQANMMLNDKVIPSMKKAFLENSKLPLAERIIKVFEAAESVGGDIRGKQSAALIVVGSKKTDDIWKDKKIDLRVDDSENPVKEIKRLLKVHRAYEHMNNGDLAIEENNMEAALKEYSKAQNLFPENVEMSFWKAVTMINNNKIEDAKLILKEVFQKNNNWRKLILRLPDSDLISLDKAELEKLLNDI